MDSVETILENIERAAGQYHRLIIVAGRLGAGKTKTLKSVCEKIGVSLVNLNMRVSSELLELPEKQRPLKVRSILDRIVAEQNGDPVVLDNTEIVFSMYLKQDPLRLFQSVSRNKTVIVSWFGIIDGGKLLYAEKGHKQFRCYRGLLSSACDHAFRSRCRFPHPNRYAIGLHLIS